MSATTEEEMVDPKQIMTKHAQDTKVCDKSWQLYQVLL